MRATTKRWAFGGAFVGVGVVGGLIGAAIVSPNSSSASNVNAATGGTSQSCAVSSVADKVLPSVVTISAKAASGGGGGTGSGEVIKSDGYILTNNHVIAGAVNGGSVEVLFADGTAAPATIAGRDTLTDLAVLKVKPPSDVKVITLGSSASVQVGQPVVALGAPLGLSGTVTSGIVSALDRTIEVPAENDQSALLVSALQTDAAINPGNSGGALVNCGGELIGVPSAGATVPSASGESSGGSIGLGFAIPVDVAKTISDELIAHGRAIHAFFGVQTVPMPDAATAKAGVSSGLFVVSVVADGPTAKAGLRQGDIITKIDGQPATSNVQLQELTITKNPGDKVTLDYVRNGHSASTTVTLAAQP